MRANEFINEQLEEGWLKNTIAGAAVAASMLNPAQADTSKASTQQAQAASVQQDTIDYRKQGPMTKDSMGQKLEYGIPITADGKFKAPNKEAWDNDKLSDKEYQEQLSAYKKWRADFTKRWPSATFNDDGSVKSATKPGLANMFPGGKQ